MAYYLPGVFSVVVVGMMFAWILQGSVGILNRGLGVVGLEVLQRRWLTDPWTALPSVALVYVWYHWGFGFLLFLAGLQGVAARAARGGLDRRGRRLGGASAT